MHAELAAREIEDAALREPLLVEALRTRSGLLATTGAHGPAYLALVEADSLSRAMLRAERPGRGLFESESLVGCNRRCADGDGGQTR